MFAPRTLFDFLHRNRQLIAGVGLFVTFWMLVYTFVIYKPSFAAKSVVIIKDSAITGRYVEPEQYYALQTTSSSSSNPVLNTMGILKSGAISKALYAYFQARHPEQLKKNGIKTKDDWEKFFQDGSSFIKAKNTPGTDLIAIQFSWSNPVIAKEALDVVVKAFQDASRELNTAEQISRTKFLKQQVVEIEEQLQEIRRQKSEYQSKTRTVNVDREGSDLAGSRMELTNRLNQIEAQARGKENLMHRYQQMLGMSPEKALKAAALGQNGTLVKLQDELYRLEQVYSQLNSSLTDTNPKVLEVKSQIEQVKANIDIEKARTMGKNFNSDGVVADSTRSTLVSGMLTAQGEAQDLRAQAAVVRGRLSQVDHQIQGFPTVAEGLTNLLQKEASLSTALDLLRQKVIEGRLKEEQTLSNVFIVDAPRLPDKGRFPTRSHLLALSLLLGLASGLAAAFAKEQLLSAGNAELPTWLQPLDDESNPETANKKPIGLKPLRQATANAPLSVTGSLLDSLLNESTTQPKNQPRKQSAPLAQPLKPVVANIAKQEPVQTSPQANGAIAAQAEKVTPATPLNPVREDLLPPPIKSTRALQAESQPLPVQRPQQGIPVTYAAPPAEPAAPVTHQTDVSQSLPFGKRGRSLPAFLLNEKTERNIPPRKQLLSGNDNLLQDVEPIGAPASESALSEKRIEPPAFVAQRQPLGVSPIWFKKKPDRHPEEYFASSRRGKNQPASPGSLNRTMSALEQHHLR